VRRHETDVTSLVFGLVFAGVVALWALVAGDALDLDDLGYLAPVLLIGAGVVGLVVSLTGSRRRDAATRAQAQAELAAAEAEAEAEQEPADPAPADPAPADPR
jgi:hypothetical protein